MSAEPTSRVVALRPAAAAAPLRAVEPDAAPAGTSGLAAQLMRQLRRSLRLINLLSAAVTYVFIVYVVPLPGGVPLAGNRGTDLVVTLIAVGLCWAVCESWGRYMFVPVSPSGTGKTFKSLSTRRYFRTKKDPAVMNFA